MNPQKNKRVLFGALKAMGMTASVDDSPIDMMQRILSESHKPDTKPSADDPIVLSWDVWSVKEHVNLLRAGFDGKALGSEMAQRWGFIKRSRINDNMMPLPRVMIEERESRDYQQQWMETDVGQMINRNGWKLMLVDKDVNYYMKDETATIKDSADEELKWQTEDWGTGKASATDKASGTNISKASADEKASTADDSKNKAAELEADAAIQTNTDATHISVVRRRLANFLATCPALSNPHVDASKLAFAILPPGDSVTPYMSSNEKRMAQKTWDSVLAKRLCANKNEDLNNEHNVKMPSAMVVQTVLQDA